MNIEKASNEEKLTICRTYFRAGFLFLPLLWTVNVFWFFNEAFRQNAYEQQKQIKKYVIGSLLGSLFWFFVVTAWIIIFQTKRADWGATADYMSFIIPLGKQ